MRVPRISILLGLALVIMVSSPSYVPAEVKSGTLFDEAIQAVDSGRPTLAQEKLRELLKKDPDNYPALVLLGQLESAELSGGDQGLRQLNAAHLLMRAAVLQPLRAEAFLALAQLYYRSGYVAKGDEAAKMAFAANPQSYEAFCLLGQRYEDSGNFTEAMKIYSKGLEHFGMDPYLTERRYLAAAGGGLTPEKFITIPSGKGKPWSIFVRQYPDFFLMSEYSLAAGNIPSATRHYTLPLMRFSSCKRDSVSKRRYKDPYEVFIKASLTDPGLYGPLRAKLDRIRKDALKVMAKERGDKAKAKALYAWLKKKVLRTYDGKRGVLADSLLKKKRYVSLNASILYALIAREAGLKADGFLLPGHFFVIVNDGLREIPVELSADARLGLPKDRGFDVVWWDQFRLLTQLDKEHGARKGAGSRLLGPLDPTLLTAYQFLNTNDYNLARIEDEFKDETQYKKTLQETILRNKRELASRLKAIRDRYNREPDKLESLVRRTKEKFKEERRKQELEIAIIDQRLREAKAKYLSKTGLKLIRNAEAVAPRVEEFIDREEQVLNLLAEVDVGPAMNSMMDRKLRRNEFLRQLSEERMNLQIEQRVSGRTSAGATRIQETIRRIEAELAAIEAEGKRSWETEKDAWLNAVTRLDKVVEELPCSRRLKRSLESLCWTAVRLAEKNKDNLTVDQVVRTGMARLPNSEFARYYRDKESGNL
jgi:tetratricopeptide (TPR) repeat protein